MSFFDQTLTNINSPFLDAFARVKVSNQLVQLAAKQNLDNLALFFDDQQVSGAGTNSTYTQADAMTTLSVSNLTAGRRVRQTYQRFNYQAGKSQNITMTYNLRGQVTGVTKRLGYYDDNNGVFLQLDSNGLAFGIRKGGVDNLIAEADWTYQWGQLPAIDWASRGITLDPDTTEIFIADFEWLGVGSVRFGFYINGAPIWAHSEHHANVADTVYMQTPNLPIRYEIINDGTGAAADLDCICSAVASDGGQDLVGSTLAIDRGLSGYSTGTNTLLHPVLSFRLRSGYQGATLVPLIATIRNSGNTNFRYGLLRNPTFAGVDAPVWTAVAETALEYDIARNNTNTVTGGFQIISGYAGGATDLAQTATPSILKPGVSITGTYDQFVIFVQNFSGQDTYYCSLNLQQLT